jgi:hypothetical protein
MFCGRFLSKGKLMSHLKALSTTQRAAGCVKNKFRILADPMGHTEDNENYKVVINLLVEEIKRHCRDPKKRDDLKKSMEEYDDIKNFMELHMPPMLVE